MKEGVNVETGASMAFSTPCKQRPRVCTKSVLDNFDAGVLRRTVHNFYLTEKQRPTVKAIHKKNVRIHRLWRRRNLAEIGAEKYRI
jgi:hypothetical protein